MLLAVVGLQVVVPGVSWSAAGGPASAAVSPPAGAEATARRTGKRVEVPEQTTPTAQVFANPDGTLTLEQHAQPVRVRRGNGWTPVDTTLRAAPGGVVAPAATPVPLAFSAGGTAPLVSFGRPDRSLRLSWPGRLPTPTLAGDTATYAGVLPGVDLRLRATAQGYSEVLLVHDRAAAANPALANLRLGMAATGLTVRVAGDQSLTAVDSTGAVVLQSPAPQMWDAGATAAQPGATAALGGARSATGRVRLGGGTLSILPDTAFLADPATRYPVSIDPDWSAGMTGWAEVYAQHPSQTYWGGDGDGIAKVGYSDWSGPSVTVRSYFQFDLSRVVGTDIIAAEFNDRENWSPSCTATEVDAFATGRVYPNTLTWNNQPGANQIGSATVAYGYSGSCPPGNLGFTMTQPVRDALNGNSQTATLMLKAAIEGGTDGRGVPADMYWKKFDTNPALIITFNTPPDAVSGQATDNRVCSQYPNQAYLPDATPTLRATLSDPDGDQVAAHFQWWVRSGAMVGETTTDFQPSGTPFSVQVPQGAFGDNAIIAWQVQAYDGRDWGPWTWCDVSVDVTRPAQPPSVTSADFPIGSVGLGVGQTGTFTFGASGIPDVAGYRYSPIDPPSTYVPADSVGGPATVGVSPTKDGPNTLFVQSVDRAGNLSDVVAYKFFVGTTTPSVGHWRLDGYHPETTVPDASGHGHTGTVSTLGGSADWTTGRVGDALHLDGTSGYVATGGGPAVHTNATFSVAAWVKLDATGNGWRTAVSEDGTHGSGFYLQYRGDLNEWAFAMPQSDTDGAVADRVMSTTPAQAGVWTHLVGTYDAGSGQMALYVNGVLQGTTGHTSAWDATGAVQIGRARFDSGPVDYWPGSIDEVQIYDRLLTSGSDSPDQDTVAEEVHNLATAPTVEEGFWPLDEGSGPIGADQSGNYRAMVLHGGVAWVPGHVGSGAVALDGATGYLDSGEPAVRSDGSFTVTALVDLKNDTATNGSYQVAVSQDGTHSSGFALGYQPAGGGQWSFQLSAQDQAAPRWNTVTAPSTASHDEWVGLAGVYDAAAGQLRLYVDGQLVGTAPASVTANVAGDLLIGRAKAGDQPTGFFHGAVDDVHVYTGARTSSQIRNEFATPIVTSSTVYSGQLSRWIDDSGNHHATSTGVVPRGFHLERSMGIMAAPGTPNTYTLYSCRYNGGQFAALDSGCGGYQLEGVLGALYAAPPAGVPSLPVYRCLQSNGDHFVAADANCEGQQSEGLYGYTLAYADLVRYAQPDPPSGHMSATGTVPGGHIPASFQPEGSLGLIALPDQPGTTPLLSCTNGTDVFSSVDATCEGTTVLGVEGGIWPTQPANVRASTPLYRCRITSSGQHFDSVDPYCENQHVDGTLGYVVLQP